MWIEKLEEFLQAVLDALKARREIVPLKNDVEKLRTEISDLKSSLEDEQSTVKNLRGDVEKISAERDGFKSQLENFNDKLKKAENQRDNAIKTADHYRDTYSELEKIYNDCYLQLDAGTRNNLAGIFGNGNTALEFLSGAVQEQHLHSLWDYTARHNIDTLKKIFDFAFAMYNKGFKEPPYTRLEISPGHWYDDELMKLTPSSLQSGNVSQILFQGYRYGNGNVIKKSIVELN